MNAAISRDGFACNSMEPRHLDDRTLAARLLSGSRLRGPLLGWAACSAAGTLASGIRPLRPNPARRVAADRELRKGRRNKFKNQKGLTRAFTSAKNPHLSLTSAGPTVSRLTKRHVIPCNGKSCNWVRRLSSNKLKDPPEPDAQAIVEARK